MPVLLNYMLRCQLRVIKDLTRGGNLREIFFYKEGMRYVTGPSL